VLTEPRIKWTDALVEQQIRALCEQVGHFPSDQEMQRLGYGRLANAINKRGGIIAWSERIGVARPHSDSDTGWDGEEDVAAILVLKGFRVTARTKVKCPYDLLVNECVTVDVKTARQATYLLNTGQPWSAWYYRIGKSTECDVVILYQSDTKTCYVLPRSDVGTTNITISPRSPKYARFRDRFDIISSIEQSRKPAAA
jgi:hypothetical protein